MAVRICISALCALAISALLMPLRSDTLAIAQGMAGEAWYALTLRNEHVGYFHTVTEFDHQGGWTYRSRTHVLMQPGEPLDMRKELAFDPQPPHQLRYAHQSGKQGNAPTEDITLKRNGLALVARNGSGQELPLDWQITLDEYLQVERWLHSDNPQVGDEIRAPIVDLSRGTLRKRSYRVSQRAPWALIHDAPIGPSEMVLDEHYLPEQIRVSGLFDFERTSFAAALAPANPAFKASYKIPLEQPLTNLAQISQLTIEIDGANLQLRSRRGLTSSGSLAARAASTLPTNTPQIRALNAQALGDTAEPSQALSAMVRFVHQRLNYRSGTPPQSVTQSLDVGYGECTAFADLFTAMARTNGWSARTVYGLAYDPQSPAGLAMHAWNEVEVAGRRFAVDPTFNQVETDAAHFAVDDDTMAQLKFLRSDHELKARVVAVDYVDSGGRRSNPS